MAGVLWGAVAGVAFGLFQATNRRANRSVDAFLSTFTVIIVSLLVLLVTTVITGDLQRLDTAPRPALIAFAAAGVCNFFLGWTFLAMGQRRVGASRTSVVAGTAPLFGTLIAFVFLDETVAPWALAGVVLVVVAVPLITPRASSHAEGERRAAATGLVFGLLTAVSWSLSAVFARQGLALFPSPIAGVTVGMAASAALYSVGIAVRRLRQTSQRPVVSRSALVTLVVAGVFVAAGIGTQWVALSLAPVAIVMALNQLAVPVVVVTAPLIVGVRGERLSGRSAVGAVLAVAGTLLMTLSRA